MYDKNQIINNFHELAIDIDDNIANLCVQLCDKYGLSETDIVDQWMAFSVCHRNVKISPESLNLMERKELSKNQNNRNRANNGIITSKSPIIADYIEDSPMCIDVPSYYQTNLNTVDESTPKSERVKAIQSEYKTNSPRSLFSPHISPVTSVRVKKYDERTNARSVQCSFGSRCDDPNLWTVSYQPKTTIEIAHEFSPISNNVHYMYELLRDRIQEARKHAEAICTEIIKQNSLAFPLENLTISNKTSTYAGRIVCDSNGKINRQSMLLDCCLTNKIGRFLKLDTSSMSDYYLFPGQVVVVEGKNPVGHTVVAENMYCDVQLDMCDLPREFLRSNAPLHIVIAAAPFTLGETLSYQPMHDLAKYIGEHNPQLVILLGPIVDSAHTSIKNANLNIPYLDFYVKLLTDFLNVVKPEKSSTKVVVVSNWREAGQRNIFPTSCPRIPQSKDKFDRTNVLFVPDPCIIDACGFKIGVSGTDVMKHLLQEELACVSENMKSDRLGRAVSHLFQQRSFYPLMPANETLAVDMTCAFKHAELPFVPHAMILPSDLRHFIKTIKGCVVLNPEKLAREAAGGNFARIRVDPPLNGESWSPETHVSAQILKI